MIENQNASPEQDALRTELLDLLRRELRPDTARLALLLGTPESEVKAELERLEAEGIILGYGATVDETRLNGETVTGLIELRVQPQRDRGFDRIAQRIYRFPQVQSCYLMSGDYDLLITVEGRGRARSPSSSRPHRLERACCRPTHHPEDLYESAAYSSIPTRSARGYGPMS